MFEQGVRESGRSEQAEFLAELLTEKDFATKTRWKNPHNQAVFQMIGFDNLAEEGQKRIAAKAYDRPKDSPITIGDYFFVMNYLDAVDLISDNGKSRDEYVAALGASARAEEAKTSRLLKGLFGS